MRWSMGLAALVATAVCMVGASSALARTPHPGFYGVYLQPQGDVSKDVDKMANGNIKQVRLGMRWASIEPRKGEFHWDTYDQIIGDLASHGIHALPVLIQSPRWAESAGGKPPVSSDTSRNGWTDFVTQAVNRYGPGGTYWSNPLGYPTQHPGKAPMPVKAWQVWNEENLQHYFQVKAKVAKYAKLLKISHDAIKAADSKATVVLGGLVANGKPSNSLNGWKFLDQLYQRKGVKHSFDVAALHPYAVTVDIQTKWIKKFHRVLSANGDGKKPLWITEVSWGSAPPDKYGFNKGRKGQKQILTQSFKRLWRQRHKFNLDRVYWFEFRDPEQNNPHCSFCRSSGLLKVNYKPKPSWKAFKRFTGG